MDFPHLLEEAQRVAEANGAAASDRDRLQVLRPHDGAHPGAAVHPVAARHERRESHAVLAGDADRGHLDVPVVVRVPNGRRGFDDVAAGKIRAGHETHPIVGDEEVHQLVCAAGDDDLVEAGEPELRPEVAAGGGVAEDPGQGRARRDRVVRRSRQQRAGERADAEDEDVVRAHRVGGGIEILREAFRVGGAAADHVPNPPRGQGPDLEAPRREVHAQDPPAVPVDAVRHGSPPSRPAPSGRASSRRGRACGSAPAVRCLP